MKTGALSAQLIMIAALAVLVLVTFSGSANPVGDRPVLDTSLYLDGNSAVIISFLFLVNLMINLLFYSAGLLTVFDRWGRKVMRLPKLGWQFISLVLLTVVVITLVGAFVDYYVAAQVYVNEDGETHRAIIWDPVRWFASTALIFLSIMAASVVFLGLRSEIAFLLSGVMALISPVWWTLAVVLGTIIPFVTIIASLIIAPVLLRNLLRSFNRVLPADTSSPA